MNESHPETPSIACIGEVMIELSVASDSLAQPGEAGQARIAYAGDTFNTAVYLKRAVGPSAAVAYVTALGTDRFSDQIIALMQAESVSTDQVRRVDDRLPGLYAIATDEQGDRSFAYWRENSAARTLFQDEQAAELAALDAHHVVYFSAITLAILSEHACDAFLGWVESRRRAGNVKVAFDSNYRPRLWQSPEHARAIVERAWRSCDIGLPSVDDEMALFGDADRAAVIERLHGYGVHEGALKCGPSGPVCLGEPDRQQAFEPAVAMVDSTAAGDSFNGAYLASLLSGHSSSQALQAGHSLARAVVGHRGAIIPQSVLAG